jgi:Cof subfamily protein (haloacid dehalogenase superfamily)
VSDVDGTLFHPGDIGISARITEMIKKLGEYGIHFCAASGRQHYNLQNLFREVKNHISYICENGAVAYHKGVQIFKSPIKKGIAFDIIEELLSVGRYDLMISTVDKSFLMTQRDEFESFIRHDVKNHAVRIYEADEIDDDILKVSAFKMNSAEEIKAEFGDRWRNTTIKSAISGASWLDFNCTDKGRALEEMKLSMGIKKDQIIVFGDNYNDLQMFDVAGTAYAMSSSKDEVKKRADFVTDSVEDVIEKFFDVCYIN